MPASHFLDLVGNTPLIKLRAASEATGCDIYGKAEFMNPGGSVKDRAAKAIIETAEQDGLLKPGGLIVEGTAGNTGISLTMAGNARGYRTVIVMPETQSQEKKTRCWSVGRICALSQPCPIKIQAIMSGFLKHWPMSWHKPIKAGLSGRTNLIIPPTARAIIMAQPLRFGIRQMARLMALSALWALAAHWAG